MGGNAAVGTALFHIPILGFLAKNDRWPLTYSLNFLTKANTEMRQSVVVGAQGEAAAVFEQDFPNEDESEALPVGLGGEEGTEELGGGFLTNALARIHNL